MSVLILGGAGFIGGCLVNSFQTLERKEVFILDNFSMGNNITSSIPPNQIIESDIRDCRVLIKVIRDVEPQIILHLAANSDIKSSESDPDLDFNNTFGTTSSLICSIPRGLRPRVIFSSSSAIFGNSKVPLIEDAKTNPVSLYGKLKLASELVLVDSLKCNLISELQILRFPNVVGANMTHGLLYDLERKVAKNSSTLEVLGDGYQEKPYMVVDDLIKVIRKVMNVQYSELLKLNIGPSDTITVREIVDIFCSAYNITPKILYQKKKEGWIGDVPYYKFNTTKFKGMFPDLKICSSREAITRACFSILEKI
jgi:UDP-glucose 4-epimerase